MLEVDTTIMTPATVFETSGHVARFADWMVKDTKTGEVLRADHLVKNVLEARLAGNLEAREQPEGAKPAAPNKKKKRDEQRNVPVKLSDEVVSRYEVILAKVRVLPSSLSDVISSRICHCSSSTTVLGWNLGNFVGRTRSKTPLLETRFLNPSSLTSCSPAALVQLVNTLGVCFRRSRPLGVQGIYPFHSYLRPETAQGHFLNFNRLLEFNNGRIPFASAQIGRSFRNEISPRAGLLRVREFTMAEIEHYVDPEDKRHEHFQEVRDVVLSLLDRDIQYAGSTVPQKLTIGDAVDKGIVANETLGYFLVRIYEFLIKIGISPTRLRFRQHMANEMAHYATDCWDAEIHSSYGWIECVGCADRAAYDLSVHSARTGQPLLVRQALKEPIVTEKETPEFNKKVVGKTFGKDAAAILKTVEGLDEAGLVKLKGELTQGWGIFASMFYPTTH